MIYGCLEWKFEINLYFNDSRSGWRMHSDYKSVAAGKTDGIAELWMVAYVTDERYRPQIISSKDISDEVRWTLIVVNLLLLRNAALDIETQCTFICAVFLRGILSLCTTVEPIVEMPCVGHV